MSASEESLPQNQFPMKHKGISEMECECPPFKKPRISATFPNSGLNEARTRYFKTQLCRKFRLGMCTLGSRCSFAHCIEELRRQEIGGDHRTSYEPKLCRMFSQGKQCSYGHTCRFLHARPDSMNSRENVMVEVIPKYDQVEINKSVSNESFDAEVNQKGVMQKTKLCNSWEIKGYCPFGMNCRFAHGQTELGKLDGYSTSECCRVMQTSASTATPTDASMVGGPLLNKEPCALICRFKTNDLQKISRIYADWI